MLWIKRLADASNPSAGSPDLAREVHFPVVHEGHLRHESVSIPFSHIGRLKVPLSEFRESAR